MVDGDRHYCKTDASGREVCRKGSQLCKKETKMAESIGGDSNELDEVSERQTKLNQNLIALCFY